MNLRMLSAVAALLLACDPGADPASTSGTDGGTEGSAGQTDGVSSEGETTGPDSSSADSGDNNNDDDGSGSDDGDPTTVGTATSGDATTGASSGTSGSTGGDEGGASSSGETGAEDTTGDSGVSAECDALQECCEQLGPDLYGGCMSVVDHQMPGLCQQILDTYHNDGYCTGETYCDDLGACCAELPPGPGWEETCSYYAELGNQPQCAMLIGDYQLSGYCF